jgi:hypothetical protein
MSDNRPLHWEIVLAHARKQSEADGFQIGWRAALARIEQGDPVGELRDLIPPQTTHALTAAQQTLAKVRAWAERRGRVTAREVLAILNADEKAVPRG